MESTLRNFLIQFDTRKFSDVLAKINSVCGKIQLLYYIIIFMHFDAIVLPRNVTFALDFVVLCYRPPFC